MAGGLTLASSMMASIRCILLDSSLSLERDSIILRMATSAMPSHCMRSREYPDAYLRFSRAGSSARLA